MPFVDTDINFDAPVLQTSDLRAALLELQKRQEDATTCVYCGMSIVPNPAWKRGSPLPYIHADDRKATCEDDKPVDPADDELEDWDLDILKTLRKLDKALDGGLAEERSLINEDHFAKQVEAEAEDIGVPEFIRPYVDWERYADARLADHTTVEIKEEPNGPDYTYHYTG